MLISCHDKWKAKCCQLENPELSVFVSVQIQMDFSSTDQEISLIPNISLWWNFFKIICMPLPSLEIGCLCARTHSTRARTGPV
jgi:hypothetical protein